MGTLLSILQWDCAKFSIVSHRFEAVLLGYLTKHSVDILGCSAFSDLEAHKHLLVFLEIDFFFWHLNSVEILQYQV